MTSAARFRVGQAVVTDPGGDSAGGYILVAASPSVSADEGLFLKRCSGISEHLHRSERPGPYFTFLPLPERAEGQRQHALIRRFVSGRRRGVHRVVVHMLVLPETLLDALAWDAALLSTHCRYASIEAAGRGPDGTEQRLADLGKLAAADGLRDLPDLECLPPDDLRAARLEARRQRLDYLRGEWGESVLLATLGWTFHTLLSGQGALLPQALPYQQLLHLVAAGLPPRDRRRLAWSSHFAAGVRADFRLLNAPTPEEARRMQSDPSEWTCLPRELPEVDSESKTLGPALAWVLVHQPEMHEAFEQGHAVPAEGRVPEDGAPADWSPSLLRDAGRSQRYLAWLRGDARGARDGFNDLDAFGAFLQACRDGWSKDVRQRDPWLGDGVLLHALVRTMHRLLGNPAAAPAETWYPWLEGVQARIKAAGWEEALPPAKVAGTLLDDFLQAEQTEPAARFVRHAIVPMLQKAPERTAELVRFLDARYGSEGLGQALHWIVACLDPHRDAQIRFDFELEWRRLEVVRGACDTGVALHLLDDVAAELGAQRGHPFFLPGDELLRLFPPEPRACCEVLLQLLLSERTRPSVKLALQDQWQVTLARLERAGSPHGLDMDWLPVPAKLAERGRVFLTTARWLGRNWDVDPTRAADLLAFALETSEFAAVQAFLDASLRRRPDGSLDVGWLRHLVEVEPHRLPGQLQILARKSPAAARRFGHHVDRLIELGNTGS